jgi:hypothetical protein
MQLNDILEENSIKAISDKTRIPEENLEYLIGLDFAALTKVKTLGFISILEREYDADLSALREQALEYYGHSKVEHLFPIGQPVIDEHGSKSKGLIIFIVILLVFSSWYFFTQFDKKNLNELIPFMGEQRVERVSDIDQEKKVAADLSIENVVVSPVIETNAIEDNRTDDNSTKSTSEE